MAKNNVSHKNKYLVIFLILMIFCVSSYSQERNEDIVGDTMRYKATLKSINNSRPKIVKKKDSLNDAFYLNLFISNDIVTARLHNQFTQLADNNAVNKFLIDNRAKIDKAKVIIITEKNSSFNKFKDVVEILNKNGITTFNLLSR